MVTSVLNQALPSADQRRWQHFKEILSERELSDWLGISQPTLSRHRRDGTGPAFVRLSARRVGYRRSAVEAWLDAQSQSSTAEATS
jgi:predicted DNA-binding transcriptional regulator AlpA